MPVRLHRLALRLGAELAELTPAHLQALCDLHMPEDADLDLKSGDSYTTSGPDGLDELAKDVTALANARGGLIIIGVNEDSQGCAESLSEVTVSDKKIGQMYNGLRARVVPYLPDIWIRNLETPVASGKGYVLIAVPGSAIAPHAVRMTSRPQYSFARRLGRTTAWLEESEIAALYRDREGSAWPKSTRTRC
jgi:predicted HTH transcriptional regulator